MRESLIEPQALTFWDRARRLRRNQTEAERRLWAHLRFRQLGNAKFRRQHPVGRFITDFCCMERGLVIELDGGQHAAQVEADQRRSVFLAQQGYRVVRFWDHEVIEDIEAAPQRISEALGSPHPSPLPEGEGKDNGERVRNNPRSDRRY